MEYGSHVWEGSTHTDLLNRVEFKVFRLSNFPPLTDCLDTSSHRCNVTSLSLFIAIFMLTAPMNLMHLHPSCSLAAQGFLLLFIPILSIFFMQELTNIFTPSSLTLVNSYQIGPPVPASISPTVLCTGSGEKRNSFFNFLLALGHNLFNVKKKNARRSKTKKVTNEIFTPSYTC